MDAENEVARSLGRIEGKVDMIIDQLKSDSERLSAVEKKVWYGSGVAAVLAFVATKLNFLH